VTYLAENSVQVLASHLSEAAANATYHGPASQNEMIEIVGAEIQREVVRRASAAKQFAVMMDETTDVSHREQVAIYIRYLLEDGVSCVIEERLLALWTRLRQLERRWHHCSSIHWTSINSTFRMSSDRAMTAAAT